MAQFSFLSGYVRELLNQQGFDNLSEDQISFYVPQITALLEEKLGLEMMPKLNEDQLKEFAELVEKDDASEEEWKNFWYGAIPNFEEEFGKVLKDFSERVKDILAKMA